MVETDFIVRYMAGKSESELIVPDQEIVVSEPLNRDNKIHVLVWNIFKQKRADWKKVLEHYTDFQLALLQEAHTSSVLINYALSNGMVADQMPAFSFNYKYAGVMTLAKTLPVQVWGFRIREPLIRFPKSALITIYPLAHKKQNLLVANIHAVNFCIGTKHYHNQLKNLLERVSFHDGPVILAGDFNTWNQQRFELLYQLTDDAGLKPVSFTVDKRTTFLGRPLDYIFYRDLHIVNSQIVKTKASDHNPLTVTFQY